VNQFGGSLGGPIKKNKTFIFGDYQGTRRKNGGSVLTSVPTALARTGDLSEYPAAIFDPLDANGNEVAPANRSQFFYNGMANVIPPSRLSPETQAILDLVPMPNIAGAGVENNFTGSGTERFNDDAFNVRADHYWSENLHIFGRYSFARFKRAGPGAFGDLVGGPAFDNIFFAGQSDVRNQSIASGFDYTVSPTWLTDFRFGFYRYRVFVRPGGGGTPATDAGIPGLNIPDDPTTIGMPAFFIYGTGGFNLGYSLGTNQCNCPLDQEENQFQFVNNWTNIRGNHTFKFGTDIRYATNLRVPSDSHRAGELSFYDDRTRGASGGGLGLAAFLLGDVSRSDRYVSNISNAGERQNRQFFYGQDTWRITPKFTLSFGLRWEVYYPQTVTGPGAGGFVQPSTGEVWVTGENGIGLNGNVDNTFTNFAPRVGIAYQISPKTVLRMGYGRSFDVGVFGSTFGHSVTQNLPVLARQEINPAENYLSVYNLSEGPPPYDPATGLENNCLTADGKAPNPITNPDGSLTTCLGPNGFSLLPDGINSFVLPNKMRLPTVDAWNATFQHQLTPTIAVEVAYVGNKGTHVFVGEGPDYSFNEPTLEGFPDVSQNERRPFYHLYGWTQGFRYFGDDSNNRYHSLQTKVEKRFSGSYSLLAHYTLQRAWNYGGGYYIWDRSVDWGRNDFYATHVFVVNNIWELPFGRGKTYLSNADAMARAAKLLNEHQLDEAIALLSQLEQKDPRPPGLDAKLGKAYYEKRDYPLAITHLERALKEDPRDGESTQLLGISYYLFGRLPQAIPLLEQVQSELPRPDVTGSYILGVSYLQTQQWEKARLAFAKMFSVPPESAGAYVVLGQMMLRQQFEDPAIPVLRKALELDPRIPMAHFLLGEIYLFKGDEKLGLEEFHQELELNPIMWLVYWRMGDAYARQQNWNEAERALKQAIWLNQNFTGPYILLGKVLIKKGDPQLASGFLEKAVKMDPNNYLAHYLLGQAYKELGRNEEANEHFKLTQTLREVKDP